MLQRTPAFGIIPTMLPARRVYPAHAGQPMAAAMRGFRPSPYPLPKRGGIHAKRSSRRPLYRQPAPTLGRSGNPLHDAQPPRRRPQAAGAVK
jgi:hypothetical protein